MSTFQSLSHDSWLSVNQWSAVQEDNLHYRDAFEYFVWEIFVGLHLCIGGGWGEWSRRLQPIVSLVCTVIKRQAFFSGRPSSRSGSPTSTLPHCGFASSRQDRNRPVKQPVFGFEQSPAAPDWVWMCALLFLLQTDPSKMLRTSASPNSVWGEPDAALVRICPDRVVLNCIFMVSESVFSPFVDVTLTCAEAFGLFVLKGEHAGTTTTASLLLTPSDVFHPRLARSVVLLCEKLIRTDQENLKLYILLWHAS